MVSSVSYGAPIPQSATFQDLINRPQAYTKPTPTAATTITPKKKDNKVAKIIVGTLVAAAAIAGSMVAVNKFSPQITEAISKLKDGTLKNVLNKTTSTVSNWGGKISNGATVAWNWTSKTGKKAYQKAKDTCKNIGEWFKNLKNKAPEGTQPPAGAPTPPPVMKPPAV